jgi:hypothetical protein
MTIKDPPATHTLNTTYNASTISNLFIQSTFTYGNLGGFKPMQDFYQYCRPLRYRVLVLGATAGFIASTATQLTTVAFFPMNYVVEALPTFVAEDAATVASMRGAIAYQTGGQNIGAW